MLNDAVATGTGTHVWNTGPTDLPQAAHMNLISSALLIMNIVLPRLSVVLFLVHLLNPSRIMAALLLPSATIGICALAVCQQRRRDHKEE